VDKRVQEVFVKQSVVQFIRKIVVFQDACQQIIEQIGNFRLILAVLVATGFNLGGDRPGSPKLERGEELVAGANCLRVLPRCLFGIKVAS